MYVYVISCSDRIRTIHASLEHAQDWLRRSGFEPKPTEFQPHRWQQPGSHLFRWISDERVLGS